MIRPELFSGRDCSVTIDISGEQSMGRTLVDWGGVTGKPANCRAIDSIDADGFFAMLTERLGRL
ncbi:Non-specific ribonucleoside hydrolase RihC [compost metagenome]